MTEIDRSESSIEAMAVRVVELLESRPIGPALADAAELARRLGVARAWVYESGRGAVHASGCRWVDQSPRTRGSHAQARALAYRGRSRQYPD